MRVENSKAYAWSTLNNFSKLLFSFIAPIILARLLGPEAFGIIAMAFVLVGLSQIFIDFGSTEAIVKSRFITKKFLSSLFWFNLFICIFVFLILLMLTPLVSKFFQRDQLLIIIPMLSVSMFFQVASIVPTSLFRRNKDFRSITISDAISRFLSSVIAIIAALYGAGVYALVILSLSQSFIYLIIINYLSTSNIGRYFSLKYIRLVLSFTASLFYIKTINHIERQSDRLFIGPSYGDASLGIFSRGQAFQKALQRFVNGSFNPVFFSVITRENSNEFLQSAFKQSYQGFVLIMFPFFLFFYFLSNDLVLFLFGEDWSLMVELLPFFSFLFLIRPFQKVNQEFIKAKGNIFFLVSCFTAFTPLLILLYFFMPEGLGITGYIFAYIFISILFLITSTIYVSNLLAMKDYFVFKLLLTFIPRLIVMTLVSILVKSFLLIDGWYFLNLSIFGVALLITMFVLQRIQAMEAQDKLERLLLRSLRM
tara:strand:+ start:17156 stop:18595 length:1440 start_codon:yes stop_codon:yes gene_type:complete